MANQIHISTFLLPGIAGAMAEMFETAGWDGVYFENIQNLAGDVFDSLGLAAAATESMTRRPSPLRLRGCSRGTLRTR